MDLGMTGKVALVGGASQGIGYGIAQLLASEGVSVVMTARRLDQLTDAARRIHEETGSTVTPVQCDIRNASDCENAVNEAVQRCGRLDILVNNDGAPPIGRIETFDDQAWEKASERNLMSVVRLCRASIPHLRASGSGRIVNITSLSALQPLSGFGLSVATWAGVLGYSKTLSLELGPDGITVNTICPGRIDTERLQIVNKARAADQNQDADAAMAEIQRTIPVRRVGTPAEIAGLVALLCSSYGAYTTGVAIPVDGGRFAGLC